MKGYVVLMLIIICVFTKTTQEKDINNTKQISNRIKEDKTQLITQKTNAPTQTQETLPTKATQKTNAPTQTQETLPTKATQKTNAPTQTQETLPTKATQKTNAPTQTQETLPTKATQKTNAPTQTQETLPTKATQKTNAPTQTQETLPTKATQKTNAPTQTQETLPTKATQKTNAPTQTQETLPTKATQKTNAPTQTQETLPTKATQKTNAPTQTQETLPTKATTNRPTSNTDFSQASLTSSYTSPLSQTIGKSSIPTARVGQKVKGVAYAVDQGRAFHLFVVTALQKKYLFFSLLLDPIYSHIPIKMSIFKQSTQSPLKTCPKQQIDSCYIPKESLEPNQTLLVTIEAASQCQYAIKSYWSDIEHIKINQQVKFMFSKTDQKQLYHLQLDEKLDFQFLKIIIKPETRRNAFDQIKMYGTFGKDSLPSSTKYDFKSIGLWQDSEGVYLSKQQVKDLKMHLVLFGSTETIYTMTCKVSNKTYNELSVGDRQYEYLGEIAPHHDYHFNFTVLTNNKTEYEEYIFRVAIFNGDLNLQFYSNQQKTKKIKQSPPFMYMGDIQYIFSGQLVRNYPAGIFVKVFPKNVSTTYMVELEGRRKGTAIQMHEHIYQFIPIREKRQTAYFKVAKFSQSQSRSQNINVAFSLVKVLGQVGVEFFRCTKNERTCLSNLDSLSNYQKVDTEYRQMGEKNVFSFTLTDQFWSSVNIAQKDAIIIVILSKQGKEDSFAACQFNVGNRPQFLRSNKPIQSHIFKNDFKVYKYTTQDNQVNKVKLYINKIKGSFKSFILRNEPDLKDINATINYQTDSSTFQVVDNITDLPIVLVVIGIQSSTYSVVVQPIHNDLGQINSITLSEDIEFKLKILPNKYEILEIVPIQSNVFFRYKSTGALHVCVLNKNNICQSSNVTLHSQGQINIPNFSSRFLLIKIRNPSHTRILEVVTKFHSKNSSFCDYKQLGVLYQQNVKQGQCVSTILNQQQDYEVLIIREELGSLNYNMFLCDKLLNYARKQAGEERHHINKKQIDFNCKDHEESILSFIVSGDKKINSPNNTDFISLKYMVQSTSGIIYLPDGIAYHGDQIVSGYKVKSFAYNVINKIDTNIVLQSSVKLSIVAFVISEQEKDQIKQLEKNSMVYKFVSKPQNNEFGAVKLRLNANILKEYKCKKCLLIVNIYSIFNIDGQKVTFTIQITQNFVQLESGQQKKDFLLKNSIAYYGFNAVKKGSVMIEAADNNLQCTQMFLGITQYPNQQTSILKSFSGLILYNNPQPQMLYIAVKAKSSCSYYISVSFSQNGHNILKIRKGSIGQINLKQGGIHYFTYKHKSEKPFKIYSLIKYGQISMYLNQTTTKELSLLMEQPAIAHSSFHTRSDKYSQISLDDPNQFCNGCLYILAVQAAKETEGSIVFADEQTNIPLSQQKVLNDYLVKVGSKANYQTYLKGQIILQLHVKNGKLLVNAGHTSSLPSFNVSQSTIPQVYNLSLAENFYNEGGSIISIMALQEKTAYSLRIQQAQPPFSSFQQKPRVINTAEPNYIELRRNVKTCMSGFFKDKNQKIIISFSKDYKEYIKDLYITGKIDGNYTKISYGTMDNVITVAFLQLEQNRVTPFQICLNHRQFKLAVTLIQSGHILSFPQKTQMKIEKEQIFDIYPDKDFLLDLYECQGQALYSYGNTLQQLEKAKPKLFEVAAMPDQPHAARISAGSKNILLRVRSPFALVRWMNINEYQERGVGYYIYKVGSARYSSQFGKVQFTIEKLIAIRQTKTTFDQAIYSLYVSNNEEELKSAVMCDSQTKNSVTAFPSIHQWNSKDTQNKSFTFEVQKSKLSQKYSKDKNLFYSVVADVALRLPSGETQDYKFIYHSQELPAELFYPSQFEAYDLKIVIAAIVLFIVAVIIFTCACSRIIIPLIGKFRYRVMVEDQDNEEKVEQSDGSLEPPPSSERNTNTNQQTEAAM